MIDTVATLCHHDRNGLDLLPPFAQRNKIRMAVDDSGEGWPLGAEQLIDPPVLGINRVGHVDRLLVDRPVQPLCLSSSDPVGHAADELLPTWMRATRSVAPHSTNSFQ